MTECIKLQFKMKIVCSPVPSPTKGHLCHKIKALNAVVNSLQQMKLFRIHMQECVVCHSGAGCLVSGFDSALSVASMYSSVGFNNITVVQAWYNKMERI